MANRSECFEPSEPADSNPELVQTALQDYAVLGIDANGNIAQWSAGAQRVFGYQQAEVVGRSFALLFTEEDRAKGAPARELEQAAHHGGSEDERWHVRKDAERIWVTGQVRPIRNQAGELAGFSKMVRDITPQKLQEVQREALLEKERAARGEAERRWKLLEEIAEHIPAIIGLVRLPEQVYVFANRVFRAAAGGRPLVGRSFRQAHPEVEPEYFEIFDRVAATGREYSAIERKVNVRNGETEGERYFDFTYYPMRSQAEPYEAILIFAKDVTERVQGRQAAERLTAELREERERLMAEIAERRKAEGTAKRRAWVMREQAELLDLAHDPILSVRLDGTIDFWNHGAEEVYGWTRAEALGRNSHELLHTVFPQPLEQINAELLSTGQWAGELKHRTRRGAELEISTRWVLRREDETPFGWLEINRDITQQKRMQAHLRDTQKLESLGVLAGGIAHDFNNLLTGVIGNISLAAEMTPPESPVRDLLARSLDAGERAAFLTGQMLAYAGKGQFLVEPADLSEVVRETMLLVRGSLPKKVKVDLELSGGLPCVHADVTQLQQIAMNLMLNAAEAIGNRHGRVVVRTGVEDVGEECAGVFDVGRPSPGRNVVLEVRDNGEGIAPSVRPNIFDPFFTTKFTGRGLGLAATSGVVRTLNGAIQVESEPGAGSTFRVFFPVAENDAASRRADVRERLPVMVVDDERIVRETVAEMLRYRGYEVVLAENGRAAVERFRELNGRVALVLLDMTMPVMSGEETFREMKAVRADVPIVVSSGYTEQETMRRFGGLGVAAFIQKPYKAERLNEMVRKVLNGRPGDGGP
jgi:PAS domain S-box-containing protein